MYGWHEGGTGLRWRVSGPSHRDYRHRVWLSCDISIRRENGCQARNSRDFYCNCPMASSHDRAASLCRRRWRGRRFSPERRLTAPAPAPSVSAGFPAGRQQDAAGAAPPHAAPAPKASAYDRPSRTCHRPAVFRPSGTLVLPIRFVITLGAPKRKKRPAPLRVRAKW